MNELNSLIKSLLDQGIAPSEIQRQVKDACKIALPEKFVFEFVNREGENKSVTLSGDLGDIKTAQIVAIAELLEATHWFRQKIVP